MPIMDNPFACPNGHSFRANAKIRARCPKCGATARRDFKESTETPATEGEHTESARTEHKPISSPVILRQGRTPVVAKKTRTPAQLANDKRLSEMRKGASNIVKKPRAVPTTRVANGLVKARRVTKPSIPTVNKRPKRTAVAGQLRNTPVGKSKSFMDQVIDTFGFKLR